MTQQKTDTLIYNDVEFYFHPDILQSYFKEYPKRLQKTSFTITSLWRGYFATFEIVENNLFIKDLCIYTVDITEKKFDLIHTSVLDIAFPESKKCSFFSGFIRIFNQKILPNTINKVLEFQNGQLLNDYFLNQKEFEELTKKEKVY